jgi:hypothetical protein
MEMNWIAVLVAALVPTVVGFIWYHKNVMGTIWMRENNFTEESLKGGNMLLVMGLSLFLSLMLSVEVQFMVIHQAHIYSAVMEELTADPNGEAAEMVEAFMAKYGDNYRTLKHGLFHGIISAFFFALPIIGLNALFERKSFRYVAIHVGYWIVTLGIMGGIICAWV